MKIKSIYIVFAIIVFFTSCKWLNGKEGVPAYLDLQKVKVDGTSKDVSSSHNIVDAWVSSSQQILGIYEIPSLIPVLEYGDVTIVTAAGIYVDGQTSSKQEYFFYKEEVDTLRLSEGEMYDFSPTFKYRDQTIFSERGSDDFESSVLKYKSNEGTAIAVESSSDLAFEGRTAYVYNKLGDLNRIGILSKNPFEIDNDKVNAPVFLEMDYRCSDTLTVGIEYIFGNNVYEENEVVLFPTKGAWKHIYADLTDHVNILSNSVLFRIFMRSDNTVKGDYIGIDNVKLVYFE